MKKKKKKKKQNKRRKPYLTFLTLNSARIACCLWIIYCTRLRIQRKRWSSTADLNNIRENRCKLQHAKSDKRKTRKENDTTEARKRETERERGGKGDKESERGERRRQRTRDKEQACSRSTHLQTEVEIRALDAFNTQTRDVFLTIRTIVFGIQIYKRQHNFDKRWWSLMEEGERG